MTIRSVDFGRLDAESEVNLQHYFVDTGVLGRISTGRKQYVIGRKGSGKTALFRSATEAVLGRRVVELDFVDYPWEVHRHIRETGLTPESAFVSSWRFFYLSEICRVWASDKTLYPNAFHEANQILKNIFKDKIPGNLESLIDGLKRIRRIDLPEIEGVASLGGLELSEAEGPLLATAVSQWSRLMQKFVENHFDKYPISLKLDRLDDGWDASADSKAMLVGIIKAARDLNLRLSRPQKSAPILVFLRSDIFNELQFNDKNKISADIEYLDWTDNSLISVIEARIGTSLGVKRSDSFWKVFSRDEMRQRASIQSYILKRTMGRPRDMVAFCLECQEVASQNGHPIVHTEDVYVAEERYSRHIYDELDDEMHKQLPNSRQYLQLLRDIGKMRFSLKDWEKAVVERDKNIVIEETRQRLKILFDYSIVGVQRRGGTRGGTVFQFNYHDRLLEPNFEQEVTVHPSLKKHLKLKE